MKMSKYASCLLLIFGITSIVAVAVNPEYKWKPYEREVPSDAFIAGYDHNKPVYIGQVSIGDDLVPGRLNEDDHHVYYVREDQVKSANKNLKILCSTQQTDRLQWPKTSYVGLSVLHKMYLVKGGYKQGKQIYIGRVQNGEEIIVGKIMCNNSYCSPLYAIRDGKQVEYYTFEVLRVGNSFLQMPRI